jgi:protein SDA1
MSSTTVVEVNGKSINLPLLQDKMKRQPDLYQNEFKSCLSVFQGLLPELRDGPGKEQPTICSFLVFFSHLFGHFPKDLHFLPNELVNLLEQYFSVLHVVTRMTCVKCLMLLRTKNLISPILY